MGRDSLCSYIGIHIGILYITQDSFIGMSVGREIIILLGIIIIENFPEVLFYFIYFLFVDGNAVGG